MISGSETGGQFLTISGTGFDENPGQTKVFVGGKVCEIQTIDPTSLTCLTPPNVSPMDKVLAGTTIDKILNETTDSYEPGNAGLKYEIWLNSDNLNYVDSGTWNILPGISPNHTVILDQGALIREPIFNETNDYVSRMSGFIVAPYTGQFEFYIASSDKVSLYISNTSDVADTKLIAESNSANANGKGEKSVSFLSLEGGKSYFIAAIHHQRSSSSPGNKLRISMKALKTSLTSAQTSWSEPEEQVIYLKEHKRDEKQLIGINTLNISEYPENWHFTLNGVNPGILFNFTNPANDWHDLFQEMLNPRCTYNLQLTDDLIAYTSDGDKNGKLPGQHGHIDRTFEAYCGSGLIQNAYVLFNNWNGKIELRTYPYVCFAFKGAGLQGRIMAHISYFDVEKNKYRNKEINLIDNPEDMESTEDADWKYDCWNVLDRFDNIYPGKRNPGQPMYMYRFDVPFTHIWELTHSYIDELRFASEPIHIFRKPSLPSNDFVFRDLNTIQTWDEEGNENEMAMKYFELNFLQYGCPVNRFPLLGIESSVPGINCTLKEINSTDKVLIQEYLSNYNMSRATFHCDDWHDDTNIMIDRTSRMSLAMQGTYELIYGNTSIEVPIYTSKHDLYPIVDSTWNYGCGLEEWASCWETHFKFKWNCEGGNKDEIIVRSDKIVNDGTSLEFGTWQGDNGEHDGFLFLWEMGPDFFRTPHSSQQIQVLVNDYPAWCSPSNCSYTYDTSLNTIVTGMTQNNGSVSGDIDVTIIGGQFTHVNDSLIKVGHMGMVCLTKSVSSTKINCTVEQPEAGIYHVQVFTKSKGEATYPNNELQLDVPLIVSGINPSSGSLGGGTTLTITGTGFSKVMEGSSLTVTINDKKCQLETMYSNLITCLTPPSPSNETKFNVVVSLNNKTGSFYGYTYDSASTPTVSNLDPVTSSSVLGGDLLTITGTAFGISIGNVKLCGEECPIAAWNDTEILCTLPANPDADCPPVIEVPGNGFAGVQQVPPISYRFRVTGVSPPTGSLMGGTRLTISGEGFTNAFCANITVSLGPSYSCEMVECTDSHLICETRRNYETRYIRNQGIHPTYGFGYRWSPIKTKIHPGDTVVWQWSLGSASQDKGINIFQTSNLGSGTGKKDLIMI